MGYYSDVAIGLREEDFQALWEQEEEYDYTILQEIFESKRTDDGDVVFTIEGVKWYEGFEEIKRIIDFLDGLERQEKPYSFVRIGENLEDIESYEACDKDGYCIEGIEVVRYLKLY